MYALPKQLLSEHSHYGFFQQTDTDSLNTWLACALILLDVTECSRINLISLNKCKEL